jgi:4'-phosphopantetheinyl transferase
VPATIALRWLPVRPEDPAAPFWRSLLDDEERARADRFRFAADRLSYLAAHALLRQMLAAAAALPPQNWHFASELGGKPMIAAALGWPTLRFNLTHTRGMVACAVGWNDDIGVDVEPLRAAEGALEIARQQFAPTEVAWLEALDAPARGVAFSRLWTLKEAYVKATGQGLDLPLDSFAFTLDPTAIRFRTVTHENAAAWQVFECRPEGYFLALAVRHRATDPVAFDAQPMLAVPERRLR